MDNQKDIRFFPVFAGATTGVVLEVIATLVDEIIVGNIFNDEAFAAVNLIEPYTIIEVFLAYLIGAAGAALIIRAHGAGNYKKMSELSFRWNGSGYDFAFATGCCASLWN